MSRPKSKHTKPKTIAEVWRKQGNGRTTEEWVNALENAINVIPDLKARALVCFQIANIVWWDFLADRKRENTEAERRLGLYMAAWRLDRRADVLLVKATLLKLGYPSGIVKRRIKIYIDGFPLNQRKALREIVKGKKGSK